MSFSPLISLLKERNTLLNKNINIDSNISNQADFAVTKAFVFGSTPMNYSSEVNLQIWNARIDFILTSKTCDETYFNS